MPSIRQLLTSSAILLVVAAAGFPSGQREDPIEEAEQLISEGRYNEAIEILQEVGRTDRDRFDEAEQLLREIRRTQTRYNELWDQLIEILENEPDNVAEANRIIEEMEEIDDAPTQQAEEEFDQWRNIVRLRFNLNRFEEISTRAIELIDAEEYQEALEVYADGLGIFQEEFVEMDYDDELTEEALESQEILREVGLESAESFRRFEAAVGTLTDTLETGETSDEATDELTEEETEDALQELLDATEEIAELESRIAGVGGFLAGLDREVQERRELGDPDPYLTFLRWFAYGRSAQAGREGMFAAVRTFIEQQIDTIVEHGSENEQQARGMLTDLLDEERYGEADDRAGRLSRDMAVVEQSFELNRIRSEYREALAPSVSRAEIPSREDARRSFGIASDGASAIAGLSGLRSRLPSRPSADASLESLESAWFDWASEVGEAVEYRRSFGELSDRVEADSPPAASIIRSLEPYQNDLFGQIADREAALAERYLSELTDRFSEQIADATSRREDAVLVGLDGVEYERPEDVPDNPEQPEEDDADLTYRYPSIARDRLGDSESELQQILEELGEFAERIEEPNDHLLDRERIVELLDRIDRLQEDGAGEVDEHESTLAELDEQIEDSNELRQQVEDLLVESEETVEDDPDEAERLFSQAEDALVEALELQQDPEFRDRIDERLVTLGSRIRDERYRIAVSEVRDMINEGRSLYRQDNFGEAEEVLLEARELWASVENSDNSEIEYWLRLTQSALTLQDDRELTDTDPLYRALGSYLSLAYSAFEQARQAEQEGDTEEMERQLTRAERNTQSVTVARPFNSDARVLSLRIEEMRDTDEFEEIFEQRLEQARQAAQENPQEALNDLYDLREVDSDWPGLEDAIIDVEILAGVREPPREDTSVQEAEELLAQAQTQFDQGNNEQARDLLEESIELDPDNDAARDLLDEVRLEIGSSAAPTLSSSELQQLRRAENHFIDGQIGRALLIVERLWQDEDNRDYEPLVSLRNRMVN
ncbi:MAG: hypothetical protein ACLFM0_07605 [Spirochaetales bacterium]